MTEKIEVAELTMDSSGIADAVREAKAQFAQLTDAVKQTGEHTNKAAEAIKSSWEELKQFAEVMGAIELMHRAVEAIEEAEQATLRLEGVLKATGDTVGLTKQQLDDLAVSMQGSTLFSDNKIKDAEALLLTFGQIHGEVFKRALKSSADLASVMGTDVTSAARMLGRALENPATGLVMLTRAGISFSAAEQHQIQELMKHNDVLGAQEIVLKHVEERMSGVAETMTGGLSGAMTQIHNEWDSLLSSLGNTKPITEDLIPALKFWADKLREINEQQRHLQEGSSTAAGLRAQIDQLDDEIARRRKVNQNPALGAAYGVYKFLNDVRIPGFDPTGAEHQNTAIISDQSIELAVERRKVLWDQYIKALHAGEEAEKEAQKRADEKAKADAAAAAAEQKRVEAEQAAKRAADQAKADAKAQQDALNAYVLKLRDEYMALTLTTTEYQEYQHQVALAGKSREKFTQEDANRAFQMVQDARRGQQELINWFHSLDAVVERWEAAKKAADDYFENVTLPEHMRAMEDLEAQANHWRDTWLEAAKEVEYGLTNVFQSVLTSQTKSFRDFLVNILNMVEQTFARIAAQEAVLGLVDAATTFLGSGGLFDANGTGLVGAAHSGGVVGSGELTSRMVPLGMFAQAPRFHSGLYSDEFPAILKRGESVLTPAQMREVAGAGGGQVVVNNHFTVQALDGPSVQDMLVAQAPVIAGIMADAVKRSRGLARVMAGSAT